MSEQYIVSGSNGFLGKKVVSLLAKRENKVIGLCRSVDANICGPVKYITNKEFLMSPNTYMDEKTIFIHLAFARANYGAREIAGSLDFTKDLLNSVCDSDNLERFIYISSQGVYGKTEKIRSVTIKVEPESIYSMAKYAAEKLVEMTLIDKDYCILRLDNVIQSQNLIKSLSMSAINKGCISITGGKQVFSYIDGEDAAEAIVACACGQKNCKHIYNVGPNRMRVSLIELAEILRSIAAKYNNGVEVLCNPDDTELWAGMDSEDFCIEYAWKPKYDIFQMIERVYKEVRNYNFSELAQTF